MSFDIFSPATKNDIKVGYISADLGFIDGVSICEANDYAKINPGTQFIFRTRNVIRYVGINEVNKLTPDDLVSTASTCGGIQLAVDCGPAKAFFYGGGGIGVQGNPVIGQDGAVLAVDLVAGGFGYQYPPITEVKDNCGLGAGAVIRAEIGEIAETQEVYDQEGDFEDYEICEPTDVGYGRRYDPNGKDIGEWDPTLYAKLTEDPIKKEIQKYQDFLASLQGGFRINAASNTISNWWTTRKKPPLKLTSATKVTRTKFDVDYPAWNDFMNSYAISPAPPSNVKGSDFAGIPFTFEWEEDFPYDGEYVFRGLCDNKAEFYLDNIKITNLKSFNDAVEGIKQTITKGVHRIRLDLLNIPIKEKVIVQQAVATSNFIDVDFNINGNRTAEFTHNFKIPSLGIDVFKPSKTGLNKTVNGKVESGKPYEIEFFVNENPGGALTITNNGKTITMEDGGGNNPDDMVVNVNKGKFSNVNGNRCSFVAGEIKLEIPKKSTSIPSTTSQNIQTRKVFNTVDYINKADRTLWRLDPTAGRDAGFINEYGILPFDPISAQASTESFAGTHIINWNNINFPIDGNYNIEIMVDDNVTLFFTGSNEEIIVTKIGYSSPGKSTGKSLETKFFKAGSYTIRAELEQINVGPLAKGNPMALAINIETSFTEKEIISAKSWNENPMGVALTIDAPLPPVPQEPIPLQEGRCPNNPIWSTRFPGAKEKWTPVTFKTWAPFFNRYAISPILPLSTPGTDGSGVIYRNSWDIDIPYDGFYKFQVQRDDTARIYVDGKIAFDVKTSGDIIWKDFRNKVKSQKVFIPKGMHKIEVELENLPTETFSLIDQKIFSTKDWLLAPKPVSSIVDVDFNLSTQGDYSSTFKIQELDINSVKPAKTSNNQNISKKVEVGKVYIIEIEVPQTTFGVKLQITGQTLEMEETSYEGVRDIICTISRGRFFDAINGGTKATCKFVVDQNESIINSIGLVGGTFKDGVTYEGPTPITNYIADFISPTFSNVTTPTDEIQGKTWIFSWSNVNFPEDGQYTLEAEADDKLIVRIDDVEVGSAKVFDGRRKTSFNITKGKRTIELELTNISIPDTGFKLNPVVGFAQITKKVNINTGISKSWKENPIGIGAILVPPPCPKRIRGKGVVTKVSIDDPGNGYPTTPGQGYPVTLRLKEVIVENPGINYSCGLDKLQITPDNGAILDYVCDPFGKIIEVKVLNPGLGFTTYPEITLPSDTGVNASFRPQFEVVRDPIVAPQKLLQVTDLVGLKQTGYVDGRAYYGSIFYKDGVSYAGFYETAGELVQIYATLQESITAQVTTAPSAILRQGTDVTNNDPKLNIPGTPRNLI